MNPHDKRAGRWEAAPALLQGNAATALQLQGCAASILLQGCAAVTRE